MSSTPLPSYTLVPATPDDAADIARLGALTFTQTFAHSLTPSDLSAYLANSYSPSALASELGSATHAFYLARPTHPTTTLPLLGFVQLTLTSSEPCLTLPASDCVEIQRIYTSDQVQGKGVGGALLRKAIDVARTEWRKKAVWLGVWEDNTEAQRFYSRFGFKRVGEHRFQIGECVQTDWIMELRFDQEDEEGDGGR